MEVVPPGSDSTVGSSSNAEGDSPKLTITNETVVTLKKPHRVLHFSDGTWEENSDDDEVDAEVKNDEMAMIDPTTLTWMPWFAYQAWTMGSKSLEVCDFLGEKLAAFFGITTPKYQYVIDEYNRRIEQEKQAQKQMDVEMGAWVNATQTDAVDSQPKPEQTAFSPPVASTPVMSL